LMIRGHKVVLRAVEEADYPLIHRWLNHPEVWRYMDYETPYSLADVKEDIERSRKEGHPFTILAEDRPIGRIGLNQFRRRDRICSFYMFIGEPTFWGQGYAQDAAMTLLSYAFDRWDLYQVRGGGPATRPLVQGWRVGRSHRDERQPRGVRPCAAAVGRPGQRRPRREERTRLGSAAASPPCFVTHDSRRC